MDEKERYNAGMAKRRKVLGNAWVDRANARKTPFNEEFQDFITRGAWGEIWTRPHYDERTRRILVIGTMIALGQWDEFRLHVGAALREGGFRRKRHQGNHSAAGDLLRRARRQSCLQGSGRGDRRDWLRANSALHARNNQRSGENHCASRAATALPAISEVLASSGLSAR